MAISLREKKGVTDFQGKWWSGDWKYVPKKEDCNDRPNYEIQALFTAPPVQVTSEGLVKAVRFYEQVKRENPPVETGAWKDAVDWVLKEACCAVILGKADNLLASSNQVSELTMWVKRLVSQLKKAKPDCKLPEKAMDYLKRNGLISVEDVLR
ncbi:bacteriophage protein [Shigella dysenteriae]|nr:bacteriophage protein [Shigella dysenteriae]